MAEGDSSALADRRSSPLLRLAALAAARLPAGVVQGLYRLGPISRLLRGFLNRAAPAGLSQIEIAAGPIAGARILLDLHTEKDLWLGTYEPDLMDAIEALVRPGTCSYDIGAHIGYITLAILRKAGPQGQVVAFEPLPENLDRLVANLRLNGFEQQVRVEACAVGAGTGQAHFLLHRSPGMGKLEGSLGRQQPAADSLQVQLTCLDHYILEAGGPPPQLVKMDIEGAEVAALQGMRQVLRRHQPILLIELHGAEAALGAFELLRQAGYRLRDLRRNQAAVREPAELGHKAYVLAMHEGRDA